MTTFCASRDLSTAPFPPSHNSTLAVSTVGVSTTDVTHSFFFFKCLFACIRPWLLHTGYFLSLEIFHCDI